MSRSRCGETSGARSTPLQAMCASFASSAADIMAPVECLPWTKEMQYHTLIPVHNVDLTHATSQQFSAGVALVPLPQWVHGQTMLESLSAIDRAAVKAATHAFLLTYTADALGTPDPDWKGAEPKSIQESKYELGLLANLACWLAQPSPACFHIVIHAPHFESGPVVQQIERNSELLCHPENIDSRLTEADLPLAAKYHEALVQIPRDTALWTAVRSAWAGLQMNHESIRFLLFWVGIEAMFGPEDGREINFRLSQRVGFFVGQTKAEARDLFDLAKAGYGFRSKLVHGQWKEDPRATKRMAEAERLFRRAFVRILSSQDLVATFTSKKREQFLDGLAFNGTEQQ